LEAIKYVAKEYIALSQPKTKPDAPKINKLQNTIVKYLVISFLLMVYLNRGIFITPYEAENEGNKETNSVIEWIAQLITGESNDIDEDGDSQTDWNYTQINLYDFSQELTQCLDGTHLFSKDIGKIEFPHKENIPQTDFCFQIDHPPKVM
jgi:hypothetical protein